MNRDAYITLSVLLGGVFAAGMVDALCTWIGV